MKTSFNTVHDPDGVPHQIVGLTWVFALAVAIIAFAALTMGGLISGLALLAVPTVVVTLAQRARAKRGARRSRIRASDALFRG